MNASQGPLVHHPAIAAATADPVGERTRAGDVEVMEFHAQPPPSTERRERTESAGSGIEPGRERRRSGQRRRASDRLYDRATRDYSRNTALERVRDVETMMLFVDDDLRETALSLGRIETYLVRTLQTLERPDVRRKDVTDLAADTSVLDHLDLLNETVESLRRRLTRLASRMR